MIAAVLALAYVIADMLEEIAIALGRWVAGKYGEP